MFSCKSYYVVAVASERMKVIPVDSFEEHSKIYHERRNAGFETEYEVKHYIIVGDVHYNPLSHADPGVSQLLYNKPKNRFANIFPCECTTAVSTVQWASGSVPVLSPQMTSLV